MIAAESGRGSTGIGMRLPSRIFTALAVVTIAAIQSSAAGAGIVINIDKSAQRMTVAVDGAVRHVWAVSTGRPGYATPSGSFRPFRLEKDHYSKEWDDAPMPHSIFFTAKGHAIHGSYETRRLGRAASHGCVRLAPGNAAKLFALVNSHGLGDTKVVLTGGRPALAGTSSPRPRANGSPIHRSMAESLSQ
jgi:lipoprotein-anchoring transpeptidase ErfK/SrfK